MIIKIIWGLISINIIAFLIFFGMFMAGTSGRNVDGMEKGWMTILALLGLVVIMLAAIPIRISQTPITIFISAFFAALPLLVASIVFISKKIPSSKKKETMAELYYKDETQKSIATAIEQNDTALLKKLIQGQDLNIKGNRVWDWDGLNYLQFAIRLRSSQDVLVNEQINTAIIRMLVEHGSATTPALAEAIKSLPPEIIELLINNGADPNTHGYANNDPLLFEAIGNSKQQNEMAVLLIQKGAKKNAKNKDGFTPLMFAAQNSGTSPRWNDCWQFVLYLLNEAKADYTYTLPDGRNFAGIIRRIQEEAKLNNITMHPDFDAVVSWLKKHESNVAFAKENG